jgi:hypothetical protein
VYEKETKLGKERKGKGWEGEEEMEGGTEGRLGVYVKKGAPLYLKLSFPKTNYNFTRLEEP